MSRRLLAWAGIGLLLMLFADPAVRPAHAELQSPNYRFDESSLGAGGLIQSNSANFQSSSSIGDVAVGDAASANFQVNNGSKTSGEPTLSFAINTANPSLGSLSASNATVTTATFSVSNYTSYGYVAQIIGDPPKNGSHVLAPMTTTGESQTGVDQFGMNLVANTLPVSVGANPKQDLFGAGAAAPNYSTSNQYRFVSGETIASAPKSSGVTTYTITYLVNVDNLTPGGQYTSNQTIVVTGTY